MNDKILVTGASGMIGSALVRKLKADGYKNILAPSHKNLDLCSQDSVNKYFKTNKPDYVFHLAAMVGGIHANNEFPADFIRNNSLMQINVIEASHKFKVKKLLFPGSACTYPKLAPQPIKESEFLNGMIEPTNISYAAAKINGIVMCQSYAKQFGLNVVIPMPTNTYGIGDNFDPKQSHVIPALMKKFTDAKKNKKNEVVIWGTGNALREFIYVDDVADSLVFLMKKYNSNEIINVGTMDEISISKLANKIAKTVGYSGKIVFDRSKPDGAPRKCLDSNKLKSLGWSPNISLDAGLKKMYKHHFNS